MADKKKTNKRKGLQKYIGQRRMFKALYVCTSSRKTIHPKRDLPTVLLTNITDVETGEILADHCWCSLAPEFKKANLQENTLFIFEATVGTYIKGYLNKSKRLDNHMAIDVELYGIQKVIPYQ